ncbi:MAG: F0F1 ATP synthase subunit epsilon [Peptococcaceae bacterium]|jgi:F-type H+-transporting ATPase subunit epsilon|nr:F0F1 ATP synthase subunit epsilon [Peptococcaceae bacterium]
MTGKFNFKVVAPDGLVLDKDVEFVLVRSEEGDLGILAHHAPLIASLKIGVVSYRENGVRHKIAVSGGFMEVIDNKVTILANTAETAEEIDLQRAQAAKERAEKRLQERKPGTDIQRAEIALRKALSRINAAE